MHRSLNGRGTGECYDRQLTVSRTQGFNHADSGQVDGVQSRNHDVRLHLLSQGQTLLSVGTVQDRAPFKLQGKPNRATGGVAWVDDQDSLTFGHALRANPVGANPVVVDSRMAKIARVLGGFFVFAGGVVVLGLIGLGWAGYRVLNLRNTQAYAVSTEFLKNSPEVRAKVGEDAQINPLVWGQVDSRVDGSGEAELVHLITSSQGPQLVTVQLTKKDDVWAAKGASGGEGEASFMVDAGRPLGQESHDPAKAIEAISRAEEAYAKNDYLAALTEYDAAVTLDPNNPSAWLGRGKSYGHRGEHERAVSDLQTAARLAPRNADAWESLAWAAMRTSRDQLALDALNQAVALNPANARALGMRADAKAKLGNMAEAKIDADAACKLGDAFACNLQGRLR